MKLLNCHIENFGKLKNYNRDFADGCNTVMASNGQGKSTLAAFIRVMFYGFEGEGKRGAGANERKRYEPWQGGVYGGRLTFTEGEHTYTIQRTFGSKSAEDTFELRDALTNLVSNDYSANIGEELFKVNSESYMRTAYIGQNDVVTHTTDGINAKIGGIAESTNDLDSYNKAYDKLSDLLNKYSPSRATGMLYKLENEVTRLRTGVREGSVILDSIHRLEDSMAVRQEESEKLIKERDSLMNLQHQISTYKDAKAVKEQYQMILEEYKEREEELKAKRGAFPGDILTAADITAYTAIATEYNKYLENASYNKLTTEEENRLKKLSERFSGGVPDTEETGRLIRRWRDHDRSLNEDSGKRAELKVLQSEYDSENKDMKALPSSAVFGMVAILISMIGAVASIFIMPSNAFRWIGVIVAGLVFIGGTLLTIFGIRSHRAECQASMDKLGSEMNKIENVIKEGEDRRKVIVEEIKAYLDRYKMPLDPASVAEDLNHLHTQADDYGRLYEKRSDHVLAATARDERKDRMNTFLDKHGIAPEADYLGLFTRLNMDLRSYNEALERKDASEKKLREFEASHDVESFDNIVKPDSDMTLEQIHSRLDKIGERHSELAELIRDESRQHDALAERLTSWEEDQQDLGIREQELLDGKHAYKNLKMAAKYLTLAKESITARYMEPLLTGFCKYYSAVTGTPADAYHIDANTNITVDELGLQRDTVLLSTGYQDLIGFCMRLSLIDAMYEGEKPVLILDDPFVNLDSERLKGAERLIEKLSESYQMIYFTCR